MPNKIDENPKPISDKVTTAANPYFDQQVQPGQVIGYNIPTNQKVEIPIVKAPLVHGPSKKFLRRVIGFLAFLIMLAILAGLVYLGMEIISS